MWQLLANRLGVGLSLLPPPFSHVAVSLNSDPPLKPNMTEHPPPILFTVTPPIPYSEDDLPLSHTPQTPIIHPSSSSSSSSSYSSPIIPSTPRQTSTPATPVPFYVVSSPAPSLPDHTSRGQIRNNKLERAPSNSSIAEQGEGTPLLGDPEDAGKWYEGPLFVTGVKFCIIFAVFTAVVAGMFWFGTPTLDP